MRIHYNADGTVFRAPGAYRGDHVFFDSHTNETLISDVYADPSAYLVVDGVLTKDGVAVTINPPCEDCVTLDSVATASTVEELRKVVQFLIDKPGFQRG